MTIRQKNTFSKKKTSMSVKLTKSPAVCQWNWLSPCTRSSAEKRISPMGTYFAGARKPTTQVHNYDIYSSSYTMFHLIPPNSIGDLAARENQYPGAQLQYIFFLYARFHLIPPNSMGDLARKSWVRFHKKLQLRISPMGSFFVAREKPIPKCTSTIYILPLYKVSFESSQ